IKNSSALASIPDDRDQSFRIVTDDSGNMAEIGHDQSESAVTIRRNSRSRCFGISGHDGSEYAGWTSS
ncbi:hypothetical protein, partial [Acidihalobacter ferrooxydans]